MFPLFTNVALLAGLAAIAAPIVIHLLLRRKSVRLRFSTLQFFVRQDEQSMRKRKLRNLLLLAARVLLFALIVLGFARPYLPGRGAAALANRQQVILLVDTSISMQATSPGGSQWSRALEMARRAIAPLQSNDRVALIPFPALTATVPEYVPPAIALRKLAEMQPAYGQAEMTEGFLQVNKLLAVSPPASKTTLVIVSDLQRGGSQNLAAVPLPQDLDLQIVDMGERFIPNAAVTELRVDAQNPSGSHAVVASFSDENLADVPVEFKVDGKVVIEQSIPLPAGAATNLPLSLPSLAPGWHEAELAIAVKDGLTADNSRYAAFFVPEPVHCLVVETRKAERVFQEESFFITTALNPNRGTNATGPSRFICEKSDLESLAQRLSSPQPRIELVVLPGVKPLTAATARALRAYVDAGGGLMLFLGEGVSANLYNTEFNGLLPAQLGSSQAIGEEEAAWRIAVFNKASPCFLPFRTPRSGNLYFPEFTRRFSLTPAAGSTVAAEFDDEVPMLVHRETGRGRVVLANTSADTLWTDWPKHKSFVPWLQATAFYLAGRDAALQTEEAPTWVSGSEVDLDLGTNQVTVKLQKQGGRESSLTSDEQGQLRDVPMDSPGIYILQSAQGLELCRLAMNTPVAESELSLMAPAEFQPRLARRAQPIDRASAAGLFGDSSRGQELWRMLLLIALILMLVEPLVANRTIA